MPPAASSRCVWRVSRPSSFAPPKEEILDGASSSRGVEKLIPPAHRQCVPVPPSFPSSPGLACLAWLGLAWLGLELELELELG